MADDGMEEGFRRAMAIYPTGVVVVTAAVEQEPVGLALGTFNSVSLNPRLIGFFVDVTSTSWPRLRRADVFRVNVLSSSQEHVGRGFARSGSDKFAGVEWYAGEGGAPVIDGSVAGLVCELENEVEVGDHWLVLGAVLSFEQLSEERPLVFYRGGFHPVGHPDLPLS